MRKIMKAARIAILVSLVVMTIAVAQGQTPAPVVFFSDLTSGPNVGGEGNNGVYVTIWGKNFGYNVSSSYITVGGGEASSYPVWGTTWLWYQKITFQLGPHVTTGDIVVHTPAGNSNGIPFTVRDGKIFFVSKTGTDFGSGTFSDPWRTPCHANDVLAPGDTVYLMNGVSQTVDSGCKNSGWGGAINLAGKGGTDGNPIAFVAYPRAYVTIGNPSSDMDGIHTVNLQQGASHYVFSQIKIYGGGPNRINAIRLGSMLSNPKSTDYRVVGNDVSDPKGVGSFQGAAILCNMADNMLVLGNYVHDVAKVDPNGTTKGDHSIYFTTECNHATVAWNEVDGTYHAATNSGNACRGIVFHSSPVEGAGPTDPTGRQQFDLHVHDNYIHDTHCDGIHFNTVDPSQGPVEAYNNLIVRAGTGVLSGSSSNYSCIFGNNGDNGPFAVLGSGQIKVYNNTMFDCGSGGTHGAIGAVASGGKAPGVTFDIENNIVQLKPSELYLDEAVTQLHGNNNLWFGAGSGPLAGFTVNIDADPRIANPSLGDFHLSAGSPAIGRGLAIPGLATDKDGVPHIPGVAFDLGAYQSPAAGILPRPQPPASVQTIVH